MEQVVEINQVGAADGVLSLDLLTEVDQHTERATQISVVDQHSYDEAAGFIKGLKALKAEVDKHYTPLRQAAHTAWKKVCGAHNEKTDPIDSAIKIVRKKIDFFAAEQRRVQARIEAERRKEAEAADRKRIAAEAREAKKAGASETEVKFIKAQPATVGNIAAAPTFKPAAGLVSRETWTFRVNDKMKLIRAVAAGKVGANLLQVNEKDLRKYAVATKGTQPLPGVDIYPEHSTAVRSA